MKLSRMLLAGAVVLAISCSQDPGYFEWTVAQHPDILELKGDPEVVDTPLGQAVEFDGLDDGVFLDSVPVAGLEEFTVELVFKQDPDAAFEQRFLHIGLVDGTRILFETRVNPDSTWYLDAYVNMGSKEESAVLIDPALTHPAGEWAVLALTVSPDGMVSYVNGVEQCRSDLSYHPSISEGLTSIGVRQNKVCWFKGQILKLRITPRALAPEELLRLD